MPRGYNGVGLGAVGINTTGKTSTGATPWLDLGASFTKFGLQCLPKTTGTTAYTVVLQGTLSTASTSPRSLISYTKAADGVTVKFSTGSATLPPVAKIRANVTVLAGTSGVAGFGVKIFASAVP